MRIVNSLIIILFFFCSCVKRENNISQHTTDKYSPTYSGNFKISKFDDSLNTLITVYNPWQGAEDISSQLLIVRDGDLPEGFQGQILKGDAKRIICMSSTHIAMMDALEAINNIVGVSGKEYISNPKLIARADLLPDVGYEGNIDYEAIIASKPDLILLFSVNGESTLAPKLNELKIPYLYIGDYLEDSPLGKTEWLVPIAEVIGEYDKGVEKFKEISGRYEFLRNEMSEKEIERPKVMLNAPFGDSWFMPSTESYVARMINDAGADYIYRKNTGNSSLPIDLEEALNLVSNADYWLNIGTMNSKNEVIKNFPKFKTAKCIEDGKIYNNNLKVNPNGGNDCYESGVVNPDLILRDLIKIFHPEFIGEEFVYYHRLE